MVSPEEDVVDVSPDVRAKAQELAVDAVENCLEEVSLSPILRVKQLQQLHHKGLVDVSLGHGDVQLRILQEPQEQSVHQLHAGEEMFKMWALCKLCIDSGPTV